MGIAYLEGPEVLEDSAPWLWSALSMPGASECQTQKTGQVAARLPSLLPCHRPALGRELRGWLFVVLALRIRSLLLIVIFSNLPKSANSRIVGCCFHSCSAASSREAVRWERAQPMQSSLSVSCELPVLCTPVSAPSLLPTAKQGSSS